MIECEPHTGRVIVAPFVYPPPTPNPFKEGYSESIIQIGDSFISNTVLYFSEKNSF